MGCVGERITELINIMLIIIFIFAVFCFILLLLIIINIISASCSYDEPGTGLNALSMLFNLPNHFLRQSWVSHLTANKNHESERLPNTCKNTQLVNFRAVIQIQVSDSQVHDLSIYTHMLSLEQRSCRLLFYINFMSKGWIFFFFSNHNFIVGKFKTLLKKALW